MTLEQYEEYKDAVLEMKSLVPTKSEMSFLESIIKSGLTHFSRNEISEKTNTCIATVNSFVYKLKNKDILIKAGVLNADGTNDHRCGTGVFCINNDFNLVKILCALKP